MMLFLGSDGEFMAGEDDASDVMNCSVDALRTVASQEGRHGEECRQEGRYEENGEEGRWQEEGGWGGKE